MLTTGLVIHFGNGVSHTISIYEGYARHAILHSAGRDFKGLTRSSPSKVTLEEIARGVKVKACYISTDYDTVLKSTAEFEKRKPVISQTETSSLLAPNVSVTVRSRWNRRHFFPLPHESDANIREIWYANVVLSGRTTMFQWIYEHMARNRRRWLHPR